MPPAAAARVPIPRPLSSVSLGRRYPVRALEEALGEGIMSGHPAMPEFRFEPDDVGAIVAWLEAIQER
jgi:cytochrome c